jgi:hypothetical protein
MGYSHSYYKKEIKHTKKNWNAFLTDVKKIACRFKLLIPQSVAFISDKEELIKGDIDIKIGDGMGEGLSPEFDEEHIWFNGVGKDSHETFNIDRDHTTKLENEIGDYYKEIWKRDKYIFGFTKTNRKPYDLLVTATLVLYKHHFKHKVMVKFDDGYEGFKEGLELVNSTLGYEILKEDIYNPEC